MFIDKYNRIFKSDSMCDEEVLCKVNEIIKMIEAEAVGLKQMKKSAMMLKLLSFKRGRVGGQALDEVAAASRYMQLMVEAEEYNRLRKKYSPNSVNFVLEDW